MSRYNEVCEGYVFTRVCVYTLHGQVYPPLGAVHAGRYGQQAGGTHPTGMHSCFVNVFQLTSNLFWAKPANLLHFNWTNNWADQLHSQFKNFPFSNLHCFNLKTRSKEYLKPTKSSQVSFTILTNWCSCSSQMRDQSHTNQHIFNKFICFPIFLLDLLFCNLLMPPI